MIRSLYYTSQDGLRTNLKVEEYSEALQNPDGVLWVDFEGSPPEKDEPILREIFHFHPLAIDDALQESHVPKVDDWVDYLYIVLHAVTYTQNNGGDIDTLELDIFLGQNYMVTHHDQPIQAVDRIWGVLERDTRYLQNGADHLLYRLADEVVASYMPVVEQIDDEIDLTEDQLFDRPSNDTLERIFQLKRATLHLRRIIGPQREVFNRLARDDNQVIDARDRVYFRDIYDHLVRIHDLTESIRDLVSGTLDTYLSVINNRMNDIMKTLTIITTLFMPLSFVAGFFGMNFFNPVAPFDAWTGYPAFYIAMIGMLLVPVVMFAWMRRRGWM
jgi:magnesium transporter